MFVLVLFLQENTRALFMLPGNHKKYHELNCLVIN